MKMINILKKLHNKQLIKRLAAALAIVVIITTVIGEEGIKVKAAEPKVMVSNYSVEGNSAEAGDTFTLNLTLNNTSPNYVRNMKVKVEAEDGTIIPAQGAGNAYLEKIAAKTETNLTFDLRVAENVEEKSYPLKITMEYEGSNGISYSVTDTIYIPVELKRGASITDVMVYDDDLTLGDEVEVTGKVNNTGKCTLSNVTVKITGDCVEEQESYIGNIEPGQSGNFDFIAKTVHSGKDISHSITVSYQKQDGSEESVNKQELISVSENDYTQLKTLKEPVAKDRSWVKYVVGGLIMAVVIICIVVKRSKKKHIMEDIL